MDEKLIRRTPASLLPGNTSKVSNAGSMEEFTANISLRRGALNHSKREQESNTNPLNWKLQIQAIIC